jgi:hypothetical protein
VQGGQRRSGPPLGDGCFTDLPRLNEIVRCSSRWPLEGGGIDGGGAFDGGGIPGGVAFDGEGIPGGVPRLNETVRLSELSLPLDDGVGGDELSPATPGVGGAGHAVAVVLARGGSKRGSRLEGGAGERALRVFCRCIIICLRRSGGKSSGGSLAPHAHMHLSSHNTKAMAATAPKIWSQRPSLDMPAHSLGRRITAEFNGIAGGEGGGGGVSRRS